MPRLAVRFLAVLCLLQAFSASAQDPRLSVLDPNFYLGIHPDLRAAFGANAAAAQKHWLDHGLREGRQPSANFQFQAYLARYPDLKRAFGNDFPATLNHWLQHGRREGRNPAPAGPFPQGALIRDPRTGTIYLIDRAGARRSIASPPVFEGCGLAWNMFQDLPGPQIDAVPQGAALGSAAQCQYVRNETAAPPPAAAAPQPAAAPSRIAALEAEMNKYRSPNWAFDTEVIARYSLALSCGAELELVKARGQPAPADPGKWNADCLERATQEYFKRFPFAKGTDFVKLWAEVVARNQQNSDAHGHCALQASYYARRGVLTEGQGNAYVDHCTRRSGRLYLIPEHLTAYLASFDSVLAPLGPHLDGRRQKGNEIWVRASTQYNPGPGIDLNSGVSAVRTGAEAYHQRAAHPEVISIVDKTRSNMVRNFAEQRGARVYVFFREDPRPKNPGVVDVSEQGRARFSDVKPEDALNLEIVRRLWQ
jgi:hypothetical protein